MNDSQSNRPTWLKIKQAYQRGEGSCRELAERFGVSRTAVQNHCKREGWRHAKTEIGRKVAEKVIEKTADLASRWVQNTIARGWRYRRDIDACRKQMASKCDPATMETLARVESRVDDMMRRAFGIPDVPRVESQAINGGVIVLPALGSSPPKDINKWRESLGAELERRIIR